MFSRHTVILFFLGVFATLGTNAAEASMLCVDLDVRGEVNQDSIGICGDERVAARAESSLKCDIDLHGSGDIPQSQATSDSSFGWCISTCCLYLNTHRFLLLEGVPWPLIKVPLRADWWV